jgi:hypothetical protein
MSAFFKDTAALSGLAAFLNSSLGVLLMGSAIGVGGLFTWQRNDWLFKERYARNQVMVDRRLNLIEQINRDTGRLLAAADDVFAAIAKRVPGDQRDEMVRAYNKEQAEWSANSGASKALLGFYFRDNDVAGTFDRIASGARDLDGHFDAAWTGAEDPVRAADSSNTIRRELEALNQVALQHLAPVDER